MVAKHLHFPHWLAHEAMQVGNYHILLAEILL